MAKILIVDDQPGVRQLLMEAFREDGHEVSLAANGSEALGVLAQFVPDLVLMDMKMPGMNGIETLREIRAAKFEVAAILMTAYGDSHNSEQAEELGVVGYLSKPFDLLELRRHVEKGLAGTLAASSCC